MEKYSYIQFPLCLVAEIYKDPGHGLELILNYGIAEFASKQRYDYLDFAKNLLYEYHRKNSDLPGDMQQVVSTVLADELLLDAKGLYLFDVSGHMNATQAMKICRLFETDEDLMRAVVRRYRILRACKLLQVDNCDVKRIYEFHDEAKQIEARFEVKFGPDARPTVKPSMITDFMSTTKDIELLCAYIGIRSIIGQRDFAFTHKNVILCRMLGAKSKDILDEVIANNANLISTYSKYNRTDYARRYHMDALIDKLQARGFIRAISMKGIGINICEANFSHMQLAEMVKRKMIKREIKNEEKKALEYIKGK